MMLNTTQARDIAWKFSRRNPEYKTDWRTQPDPLMPETDNFPFHFQEQRRIDKVARQWGLFTYADPTVAAESAPVFWSITPILEAEIASGDKPALLPMLRKVGAKITGLLLLNGNLILKVEHGATTVQVRIKDGKAFDETCGLTLRLPLDLRLPVRLTRSMDLWNIAAGDRLKKPGNPIIRITTICSLFLMASSMERAIAR